MTVLAPTAVVLVEGASDQVAVEVAARRVGRDLAAEGTLVVPMGGVTNLGRHLTENGPGAAGGPVAVLCDEAESGYVRRRLGRAGLGPRDGAGAGTTGCFVCVVDLEDELIRALGPAAAVRVLAREGDLAAFRALRRQPAWRSAPVEQQLRRFVGAGSGRKRRYARLLTAALEPAALPAPLRDLLGHIPAG